MVVQPVSSRWVQLVRQRQLRWCCPRLQQQVMPACCCRCGQAAPMLELSARCHAPARGWLMRWSASRAAGASPYPALPAMVGCWAGAPAAMSLFLAAAAAAQMQVFLQRPCLGSLACRLSRMQQEQLDQGQCSRHSMGQITAWQMDTNPQQQQHMVTGSSRGRRWGFGSSRGSSSRWCWAGAPASAAAAV